MDPFILFKLMPHLDFVDERHGVTLGHGNPMRRAAEKHYIKGLSQFGIRNVSSTAKRAMKMLGHLVQDILSVRQIRELGIENLIKRVPKKITFISQ